MKGAIDDKKGMQKRLDAYWDISGGAPEIDGSHGSRLNAQCPMLECHLVMTESYTVG